MPILADEPSRIRSTIFSPNSVGSVLTRKSIARVLDRLSLMRPSCGTRFSAMSSCAITLMREEMRLAIFIGGLATALQHAVHAQAHPVVGFERLEMDVRGAAADRIDQDLVDELHHRRVVHRVGIDAGSLGLVVADLQLQSVQFATAHVGHGVAHAVEQALDHPLQRAALDQDRFDHAVGVELDLVQRMRLHRIGDAHEQPLAAPEQRQRLMLGDQCLADQVQRHGRRIQSPPHPSSACRTRPRRSASAGCCRPGCDRAARRTARPSAGRCRPSPCARRPPAGPLRRPAGAPCRTDLRAMVAIEMT